MKRFKLIGQVTVSAYTEVEADTLEEALAEAAGRDVVIGGHRSGYSPREEWIIDDADGEVENVHEFGSAA